MGTNLAPMFFVQPIHCLWGGRPHTKAPEIPLPLTNSEHRMTDPWVPIIVYRCTTEVTGPIPNKTPYYNWLLLKLSHWVRET